MRLHPLRLALHVATATALAGGAVLLTGSPGSADDAARPESFGGDSTASAIHWMADRNPQPTPVSDAFHAELPYATTSMDSSGSISAVASPLYPGAGALGVPALLCQFDAHVCTVLSNVPRYPFIATADFPTKPDDSSDAQTGTIEQGPVSVTPNASTAHADAGRVEATSRAGSSALAGVITTGSASTHSKQAFEGSALVVSAESVVTGIDIAGQLHIDQLRSVATAKVNGTDVTSSAATTTVSGARVGPVPVTIDSDGIHVAGQGDSGAAKGAVNTALAGLKAAGLDVRLLTPTKKAGDGAAAASTGGLLLRFASTVDLPKPPPPPQPPPPFPAIPGAPSANGDYVGSLTLAGAGVTAYASPALDFSIPTVNLPVAAPPAMSGGGPAPAGGPALAAAAPAVAPPGPAGAPAPAAAPDSRPAAVLGVDLTSKRLKTLALVLLGYPLLVLLTGPLRAPARLPRVLG